MRSQIDLHSPLTWLSKCNVPACLDEDLKLSSPHVSLGFLTLLLGRVQRSCCPCWQRWRHGGQEGMARLRQLETSCGGGWPRLTLACSAELQPHSWQQGTDYQADPTEGIIERAGIIALCAGQDFVTSFPHAAVTTISEFPEQQIRKNTLIGFGRVWEPSFQK